MDKQRVIIVEDNELQSMVLEEALSSAGYEVCAVAGSQDEAIRAAAIHKPDLAVVDIDLSPGDGRIVAATLHGEYGTLVLFASSRCDEVSKRSEISSGYVNKPYRSQHVITALTAAVKMRRGEDPGPMPPNVHLNGVEAGVSARLRGHGRAAALSGVRSRQGHARPH